MGSFNTFFSYFLIFPIVIGIVFFLFMAIIIFTVIKSVGTTAANNAAAIETVEARIVTKRTSMSGGGEMMVSTSNYVTFETPEGDRQELRVPGKEYGLLAEGDQGTLTFQGTRFQSFNRRRDL